MENNFEFKNTYTFADLSDTQKQRLADLFLDKHPMRLNNSIVEYILNQDDYQNAPFTRDDITNNEAYANVDLSTGYTELTESERDEMLTELQEKQATLEELEDYEEMEDWQNITNDIQELEDAEFDQYPEIYQWFSCSDWLIRELQDQGECTLDGEFWGRQCCGQSVTLDHVIQYIAFTWFVEYDNEGLTMEQMIDLRLL